MRVRTATEDDLDRLLEIHLAAYPDPASVEVRRRYFTRNRFGTLKDLVVLERGREIVANAFLFPLRTAFGGRPVKMGGIASVAVAPEHRGQGIATTLMERLHVISDERGDALTMLYPFRQGFYARLGYAPASPRKRLAIDARSIPEAWRALAVTRVRAMRPGDARGLREVHARAVARSSGWTSRTKRGWEHFYLREHVTILVAAASATVRGYLAFVMEQEHANAETFAVVDEVVADDDETRRALLGALGALRDQVAEIVLEVEDDDALDRALVDPDGRRQGTADVPHSVGEMVAGPMVRIEDIPRALEARGYAGDGSFDVVVGELGAEPILAAAVRVRDGQAEVGPARGGPALEASRAGLAAILYGGLSVTDGVALGLVRAEGRLAGVVDAIVRAPPLTSGDAF